MAFFSTTPTGGATLLSAADTFANQATLGGFATPEAFVESYLVSQLGTGVSAVDYIGVDSAGYFVDRLFLSGIVDQSDGLFLTSGTIPGPANTVPNFSFDNGAPGDADLTATAQTAFSGAGSTLDASIIEFTLNITNPNVDGISFNLFFGSDEFPEFSDTLFTDVAAVYVNGVNVALFNNDPLSPLSITNNNLSQGNFVDNTSGAFPIEWDGFIELLTIRAPVTFGENTIKIGVADTGDFIFDSGLFINDFELLQDGGAVGGIFTVVDGSTSSDTLEANEFAEEFNLFTGEDTVQGTASELDGDVITGFGQDDALIVEQATFSDDDITVTLGSAILDIDTNNDGVSDTTVILAGDFDGATFSATSTADGTEVTVDQFSRSILDGSNSNIVIDGAINEFADFGGLDTYTILGSVSSDVTITDTDVSIVNLPDGVTVSDALFLSDGVQFTINGNTVTLLGSPADFDFVFGGTPLNPAAGTPQSYTDTATAFGTTIPGQGQAPNGATITGAIQSDGTIAPAAMAASLVGVSELGEDGFGALFG